MPANYVLLEKITVGAAGAASVTFSGIPQTGYTDLVVKVSGRASNPYMDINFNNNATGFTSKYLYGTGSAAGSGSQAKFLGVTSSTSNTANTFGNMEFYIPNYTSANYKSYSADSAQETNATAAEMHLVAGLWSNTAAITSIQIIPASSGTFSQYTTFYLYGVAALGTTPAIVPYATGGDTIMTDGTYWYHTFISSGTFTPAKAITCDYLVVAGGGSGGSYNVGGGGGAGGLRCTVTATGGGGSLESPLSLASGTGYTVTIGAGAAGAVDYGAKGSNSVFSTITATGGGGGQALSAARDGGSGGGGGQADTTVGTGTANQGYNGGAAFVQYSPSTEWDSGGGGGAGAVGAAGVSGTAGAGGNGVATSISGSSVTYAGGGGGGRYNGTTYFGAAGGSGGGGAGGANANGTNGTANLGGGGGSANGPTTTRTSGNGGSGIVIVRYAV